MENNNWRAAAPGGGGAVAAAASEVSMDTVDWRAQLQPDSRQRIVNKIMETLKRHLPFSGQEGLQELKKIAVRFEEKIYTAATSQSDYLRKISLKMLTMENKSQNTIPNPSNGTKPPDPGAASHSMQSQLHSLGQSLPIPMQANQSQAHQHLLSQNMQNTMASTGVQNSVGLQPAMSSVSGLTQTSIPNTSGQNSTMQNIAGVPQNTVSNSMVQNVPANIYANAQQQMPGRQQVVPQQQPQTQNFQFLYQQQMMMNQKLHTLAQSHMQQQQQLHEQQSLLQPNQLQTPQSNMNPLSSQSPVNLLQPNVPLQSNSSMLQQQHLKQQQEQQLMQSQQLKQHYQQRQMQQQLMEQQPKQQVPGQMQTHQMQQLHQMNDVNEMKIIQGMGGVKPGVFQQHLSTNQRSAYSHQQMKAGASFPISSPLLLQATSPQLPQHSSPQVGQQNLLSTIPMMLAIFAFILFVWCWFLF